MDVRSVQVPNNSLLLLFLSHKTAQMDASSDECSRRLRGIAAGFRVLGISGAGPLNNVRSYLNYNDPVFRFLLPLTGFLRLFDAADLPQQAGVDSVLNDLFAEDLFNRPDKHARVATLGHVGHRYSSPLDNPKAAKRVLGRHRLAIDRNVEDQRVIRT
jgi:hypothetical protein